MRDLVFRTVSSRRLAALRSLSRRLGGAALGIVTGADRAALLLAALFVAMQFVQAPHLVHHLFDEEHQQRECPFAAAAERNAALPSAAMALPCLAVLRPVPPAPAPPSPDAPGIPAVEARAPPPLAA